MGLVMAEEVGDRGGALPAAVLVFRLLLLLNFFLSEEEYASLMVVAFVGDFTLPWSGTSSSSLSLRI